MSKKRNTSKATHSNNDANKENQAKTDEIEQQRLRIENSLIFAKYSFELEEKREQSLINQSNQMLTAFLVFSAVLFMLLPLVFDYTIFANIKVGISSIIVFIPLLASMVLAVLSQWRFKYNTLMNGRQWYEYFEKEQNSYSDALQYNYQFTLQLGTIQETKKKNNDKRFHLIKASMICFLISVGLLILVSLILFLSY